MYSDNSSVFFSSLWSHYVLEQKTELLRLIYVRNLSACSNISSTIISSCCLATWHSWLAWPWLLVDTTLFIIKREIKCNCCVMHAFNNGIFKCCEIVRLGSQQSTLLPSSGEMTQGSLKTMPRWTIHSYAWYIMLYYESSWENSENLIFINWNN